MKPGADDNANLHAAVDNIRLSIRDLEVALQTLNGRAFVYLLNEVNLARNRLNKAAHLIESAIVDDKSKYADETLRFIYASYEEGLLRSAKKENV